MYVRSVAKISFTYAIKHSPASLATKTGLRGTVIKNSTKLAKNEAVMRASKVAEKEAANAIIQNASKKALGRISDAFEGKASFLDAINSGKVNLRKLYDYKESLEKEYNETARLVRAMQIQYDEDCSCLE